MRGTPSSSGSSARALLLIGLIALVRAGTDGPWDQPVVEVLGFTHTAILGIIEIAFGVCLLLCAVTLSRGAATFFGALLGIGGVRRRGAGRVVPAARWRWSRRSPGGWWSPAIVIVVVSAIVPRVFVTRTATATYVDRYCTLTTRSVQPRRDLRCAHPGAHLPSPRSRDV